MLLRVPATTDPLHIFLLATLISGGCYITAAWTVEYGGNRLTIVMRRWSESPPAVHSGKAYNSFEIIDTAGTHIINGDDAFKLVGKIYWEMLGKSVGRGVRGYTGFWYYEKHVSLAPLTPLFEKFLAAIRMDDLHFNGGIRYHIFRPKQFAGNPFLSPSPYTEETASSSSTSDIGEY